MSKIILTLAMLGSISICFAQSDVDAQIEAIQNAPAQQRVELMNEFKRQLLRMNQEERRTAISAMRSKTGTRTKIYSQEHTQEMQMQDAQNMHQMQNMNQHQIGSQVQQDIGAPHDGSSVNNRLFQHK